jgi:apolipoprotein D and lipocalin family protein
MIVTRAALIALAASALAAGSAQAVEPTREKLELTSLTGRWYEVARLPNKIQGDCQGATSEWRRTAGETYSVVQTCHKGSASGQKMEWKAKAQVANPGANTRLKMSFFGGMVNQEYWVLDHETAKGWIILGTPGGRHLWLMAQRPTLPASAKAEAVARVRALGFDVNRLIFGEPARN